MTSKVSHIVVIHVTEVHDRAHVVAGSAEAVVVDLGQVVHAIRVEVFSPSSMSYLCNMS